ncbi:MAG: hypothetical protein R3C52_06930 [Hyphomonadaceae bacterium]
MLAPLRTLLVMLAALVLGAQQMACACPTETSGGAAFGASTSHAMHGGPAAAHGGHAAMHAGMTHDAATPGKPGPPHPACAHCMQATAAGPSLAPDVIHPSAPSEAVAFTPATGALLRPADHWRGPAPLTGPPPGPPGLSPVGLGVRLLI